MDDISQQCFGHELSLSAILSEIADLIIYQITFDKHVYIKNTQTHDIIMKTDEWNA